MDSNRIFGDIPGVSEGDSFVSRRELSKAGVHRPTQAGICGSQTEGADNFGSSSSELVFPMSGDIYSFKNICYFKTSRSVKRK